MMRRDEFNALSDFLLKRQALEEQFVEIADAGLVGLLFLEFLSLDHMAHLFDDQRAVHQEERLLRGGGPKTEAACLPPAFTSRCQFFNKSRSAPYFVR